MDFYNGDYSGLIEFRSAVLENPFGGTLLRMVEKQYDDVDTAVADIAETLRNQGFDADDEAVIGLMAGEILPHEEVVELLSELAITEEDKDLLYQSAIDAYSLAEALLESDDESEDDEEDEDDDESEDDTVIEIEKTVDKSMDESKFSRYFEETEAIRNRMEITDELSNLRDYANDLLKNRHITPRVHKMLFSTRAKDDFLNFSTAAQESEMPVEDYLRCVQFSLDLFNEIGPIHGSEYNFTSIVDQEISDSPVNFSQGEDKIEEEAREMLELLRGTAKE